MSDHRFVIRWVPVPRRWDVLDTRSDVVAATFSTLADAEAYVIERSVRSER